MTPTKETAMAQEKARPLRARKKKEEALEPSAETPPAAKPRVRRKPPTKAGLTTTGPMEVATLAYLFWEKGEPGDAMEHWLRAEREIAA
jgi:Protein of unknown function (DUF2934)